MARLLRISLDALRDFLPILAYFQLAFQGGFTIFTGLVTHLGEVTETTRHPGGGLALTVQSERTLRTEAGGSVAVNGVCLTVLRSGAFLTFDVIPETIARTNLGDLKTGDLVNLEESMRLGDEVGGHLVYGHVDATTVVLDTHRQGQDHRIWCVTPPALSPMIAEKGYVALDGVSLTIAAVDEGQFAVALIPETLRRTNLGRKETGSVLNLEADPIARYVAHVLGVRP